jgi:hypothetical protein
MAPFFAILLLAACSEPDPNFNIPNRDSLGMSSPLIEVHAPLSGSTLPANTDYTLDYAILRSEDGHHIKIYVDKNKPMSVFKLEGKHRMHGLPAGKHRIRIIEYTKDGRKTGGNITLQLTMVETNTDGPADDAEPSVTSTQDQP